MPVVRSPQRYDSPQVQQAAIPGVRADTSAPIEAFGGGRANQALGAVADLSNQAVKVIQEEEKKADEIAGAEAWDKLKQKKIDLLLNKDTGALNQKGKNSFSAMETVPTEFDKFGQEVIQGLSNDRQREIVYRAMRREKMDINEKLNVHIARERDVYDNSVTQGLVKTATDEALLNYNNPTKVEESISIANAAIMKLGERNGIDNRHLVTEQTSQVHASIIDKYLNNQDDRSAKAYFEANGDKIVGKSRERIEQNIAEGSRRGESQRASDRLLKQYGDNMAGALAAAREIQEPNLRDDTLSQLKQNYADIKTAKSIQVENMHRNAANILDKTPDISKIPLGQWNQFSVSERQSLKAYAKARSEGSLETDWSAWYNLKTMAATPGKTQEDFKNVNLFELYRGKMADPEFKELVNLQDDLRKGGGKAQRELDGFLSTKEIVDGALRSASIDPTPKDGTKDADRVYSFKNQVNTRLKEIEARTGKKPTSDDEVKIVNGLLTEAVLQKRAFFLPDKKKKIFETGSEDIPPDVRANIEKSLKNANRPVNDETVLRTYQTILGKNPRGN